MKKITKRILAALGVALAASLVLAGCSAGTDSSSSSAKTPNLAVFTVGYGTPAVKYQIDEFQKKATGEGWKVTLYSIPGMDFDKMNAQMTSAASQGFNGYVLAGFDPRAASVGLKAAKDSNIPVFAIDGDVKANSNFTLDVVSDQKQIAQSTTKALIAAMGGSTGKKVMIITFDPSLAIATRATLAQAELKAAGVEIVAVKPIQDITATVQESLNFVKTYLQSRPGGLDGVWTGLDPAALGATQAVAESGAKVSVTGVDGMGAAVELIKKGSPLVATAQQDWDTIVGKTVTGIKTYFSTGKAPASNFIEVPSILIDKANASTIKPSY